MKRVECRDRERCNETRESLLDDDVCISHGGNSSPALRRKRPTGDIQTQTQKPLGRDSNRTADGSEPLARRTKAADTSAMDIDVISDQAQHPKANTESNTERLPEQGDILAAMAAKTRSRSGVRTR